MRAAVLAAGLLAFVSLGGCRSIGLEKGAQLSYAQVQSIHTGLTSDQVIDAFGPPGRSERGPDGRITKLDYPALDGRGNKERLLLDFDERGVLVAKRFTGAVNKP